MTYLLSYPGVVGQLLWQHFQIVSLTLLIAGLIALPLALLIHQYRWLNTPILGTLGVLYTIPSLALMILLIPLLGLNARSVIVAIVIYSQAILVRSLVVGLESIDASVIEVSKGMGMNSWQRWWQVQFPLMLPIFLAGLRLAAIVAIAIATIGAKLGAGGLGTLLFEGIAQAGRYDKIWAGVIAIAFLAFSVNSALLSLERVTHPTKRVQRV
jgi:osmoprotectant transport system permease protein